MIHTVKAGEMLWSIAEDYRLPIDSIIKANPTLNPNQLYVGQKITIPGFPPIETLSYSIFIKLSERKLTLRKNGTILQSYPIAVGRDEHPTPIGNFIIINKAPNPGGVYGTMWMSISKKHYGIHGTNNPSSIGKFVSRGCIRMHNKDVEELTGIIPVGTPVTILN
ncbi:L,D-transpeptidase family protein [Litchfieldia alkalitelluris]|uniref:L,D-transpeptidase family protein n=1 Tax=Litchfieldia alkalitelluris TaxID=304268 RepID=UPI000997A1F5|nr:L,D-transpeptidase family protein [Litchfieldia alkalitelluris]